MNIDVKVPLPNGKEITLHCLGETLYEWQIIAGWLRENPVIYWNDADCKHWFFDFVIAIKNGFYIWCEGWTISSELDEFVLHFYRR